MLGEAGQAEEEMAEGAGGGWGVAAGVKLGGGPCQNSLVVRLKPARPGRFPSQSCSGASMARTTSQSCSKKEIPFLEREASLHHKKSALQASYMRTGAVTDAARR